MLFRPSQNLPGLIEPCIQTLASRPLTGIKYDGYRLQGWRDGGRIACSPGIEPAVPVERRMLRSRSKRNTSSASTTGAPCSCAEEAWINRREDALAHHYQLKGGSLMVIKYSNVTDIQFSFYVYDQDSKSAAYCWYASDIADEKQFWDADTNSKLFRHQAGIGNQIGSVLLEKPLNFKQLETTKCSFTLAGHGSSDKGVATLFREKAPLIHLTFPIVADFDLTTREPSRVVR